jgi:glycosyltransferase involved in cell wall biosynthesis
MVTVDDLPIARAEIELSAMGSDLDLPSGVPAPSKIMTLVRLHTRPVGVVFLDGKLGLSLDAHAADIWAELGDKINVHLAADGLAAAGCLNDLAGTHLGEPHRCEILRIAVLADPPLITVVVATRDRADKLGTCLNALLKLEYPNYEIVVVDNDPPNDDTATLIRTRFHAQVRYVREGRRGLASAHNCGLNIAKGQCIAFVDDDVVVDEDWLTAVAEGFAAGDDVGCVTGLILPAQLETEAQLLLEQHGGFDKGFELRLFDMGDNRPKDRLFPFTAGLFGSGANMAFNTQTLRQMGGFDSAVGIGTFARGGDDLAAFFRTIVTGHQLVYQPGAVVWHQHHRELAAVRRQVHGYGVGLGAFLASAVVNEPRMFWTLLRRWPAGIVYAFSPSSPRNEGRYDSLPSGLAKLETRGLLWGPVAYAVSRWRAHRARPRRE